jgi:hypothetical protein
MVEGKGLGRGGERNGENRIDSQGALLPEIDGLGDGR